MALRTSLVAQPHLYMGDTTGRPLDAGKVYFGQPNKDPEFYPINVFYDEELTIPAMQPIRTKGGFMHANGQMVEVYAVEVEYSVKVLDVYGRQVFYGPVMSGENAQLAAQKLDTGITATSKYGGVSRRLSDVLSEKRRTPRYFGALGGDNDDTLAVIACIKSGYSLIDDVYTVKPFVILDKQVNIEFSKGGQLSIIEGSKEVVSPVDSMTYLAIYDSVVFEGCSGSIKGMDIYEPYHHGSRVTLVFFKCVNLEVRKLRLREGKLTGVTIAECINTHIYNGYGTSENSQTWSISGSINSSIQNSHVDVEKSFGFLITGNGYKSSARPAEIALAAEKGIDLGHRFIVNRDQEESLGMRILNCYATTTSLSYDINGAVGAVIDGCYAVGKIDDLGVNNSTGFQIKQSTNIPAETKRLTHSNTISNCYVIGTRNGVFCQNGESNTFQNMHFDSVSHAIMGLNDTPNMLIDGVFIKDCFLAGAGEVGDERYIFKVLNASGGLTLNNIKWNQTKPMADMTAATLFDFKTAAALFSNVSFSLASSVVTAKMFGLFSNCAGLYFEYAGGFKLQDVDMFKDIISDGATSTIYPVIINTMVDLENTAAGNYPFSMPNRGLVVGAITYQVIGSGTATSKLALGHNASIGAFGYIDLASMTGWKTIRAVNSVVPSSTPLVVRVDELTPSANRVSIAIKGLYVL